MEPVHTLGRISPKFQVPMHMQCSTEVRKQTCPYLRRLLWLPQIAECNTCPVGTIAIRAGKMDMIWRFIYFEIMPVVSSGLCLQVNLHSITALPFLPASIHRYFSLHGIPSTIGDTYIHRFTYVDEICGTPLHMPPPEGPLSPADIVDIYPWPLPGSDWFILVCSVIRKTINAWPSPNHLYCYRAVKVAL